MSLKSFSKLRARPATNGSSYCWDNRKPSCNYWIHFSYFCLFCWFARRSVKVSKSLQLNFLFYEGYFWSVKKGRYKNQKLLFSFLQEGVTRLYFELNWQRVTESLLLRSIFKFKFLMKLEKRYLLHLSFQTHNLEIRMS